MVKERRNMKNYELPSGARCIIDGLTAGPVDGEQSNVGEIIFMNMDGMYAKWLTTDGVQLDFSVDGNFEMNENGVYIHSPD
jgi:hypothetical protein